MLLLLVKYFVAPVLDNCWYKVIKYDSSVNLLYCEIWKIVNFIAAWYLTCWSSDLCILKVQKIYWQVGLCIALAFTFPVMMHPIHEIVDARLRSSGCFQKLSHGVPGAEWLGLHSSRIIMVTILTVMASFIPAFGSFVSFVGCTVCALLSFVLPTFFHLNIVGSSMSIWRRVLDYGFLLFGLGFAGYGIFTAVSSHWLMK